MSFWVNLAPVVGVGFMALVAYLSVRSGHRRGTPRSRTR
jgi:hypothetical protein